MKATLTQSYWFRRLLASDPGRRRLSQAGKATISLISSVFTTLFLLNMLGQQPLFPSILSGMAGLMGIMIVMDDTKRKKQTTTILLAVSAAAGVTCGSLLASNVVLVSSLMIVIIFCGFYFSRFGSRYFSLGMIGFFTVYLSSFLKLSTEQFPWFYLAIAIGISYAFLYNFIVFKDSVQLLKKSMVSFHRQANLTFELLAEVIADPVVKEARTRKLEYNVRKLRKYASQVSTDLNERDISEIWPGLKPNQLRLYVFDTAMFVMTLSDSLQKLKRDDALEMADLRELLTRLISALQQAEVLQPIPQDRNLEEADKVIRSLRLMIDDLFQNRGSNPEGWLYLLRRIEAIATHVTEGAMNIRYDKADLSISEHEVEEDAEEEVGSQEEEGMKPTTKKAVQSLIAGTIAILVGYMISPIQPYWVLLTTFIVQLGTDTVGRTYLKGVERSVGTVIGALIGFVLATLVSGHSELEVFLLFTVMFLAFYLLPVSYTLTSMFITMLIAFMYDLILGGISYQLLGARVLDTIVGASIAYAVSALIYPTKTMDKVSDEITDYLNQLDGYVKGYVESFESTTNVKNLAEQAFNLDLKIQALEEESKPVIQGFGGRKNTDMAEVLTIFTAINYYAKHLVASSYQKDFVYPDEVSRTLHSIEQKFSHNVDVLISFVEGNGKEEVESFYPLQEERELIDGLKPGVDQQGDLVHHLYYVWKINQSILILGQRLGLPRA
ncbi:FUSC family protein [Halobacillus litoralis]|uniref:FUSC family protein n=1 Tax=Halobacillus litoralis TaxID=45668 RepID=UPI001CFED864|nr:FUSC family protein [Halobacillus litoralis]